MKYIFAILALLPLVALSTLWVLSTLYQTNINCLFPFVFPNVLCPPPTTQGAAPTDFFTPDLDTSLMWMARTISVSASNWYNDNVTTGAAEALPAEWKEGGRIVMPLHAWYLFLSQKVLETASRSMGATAFLAPTPQNISLVLVGVVLVVGVPITGKLSWQIARLLVSAAEEHESVLPKEKHVLMKSQSYKDKVTVTTAVFGFLILWLSCILPLFVVDAVNLTTCVLGAMCTLGAAHFYLSYLESLYDPYLFAMDAFDLRAPFMKEGDYSFYKQRVAAPFYRLCYAGILLSLACLLQFQYAYLVPIFFAFLVGAFIQRGNIRVLVLRTNTKQKIAFSSFADSVSKFSGLCCFSLAIFGIVALCTGTFWYGKQTVFSFFHVFGRTSSASNFHFNATPFDQTCLYQKKTNSLGEACERPTPNMWALASRLFPSWRTVFASLAHHMELDPQKMLDVACAVFIFLVNIINVFDLLLCDAFDTWPICFHSSEAFLQQKSTHLKLMAAPEGADKEKSAVWKNVTCVSCEEFVLTHGSVLCRLLLSFCASLLLLLPHTAPMYVTILLPPASLLVSIYGMNMMVRLLAPAVYKRASYKESKVRRVDDVDARFDSDFCVDSTAAVCDASDLLDSLHLMLACAVCTDILVFPAVTTWTRHLTQAVLLTLLAGTWARILVSFFTKKFKLSAMEFWGYLWTYGAFLSVLWMSSSEKVSFMDQIVGLCDHMMSPFYVGATAAERAPPSTVWVTAKVYLATILLGQVLLVQFVRHITRYGSFFGTYQELVIQGYKK